MKMRVLENKWKSSSHLNLTVLQCVAVCCSSSHLNLTAYIQLRSEVRDQTTLGTDFVALCGLHDGAGNKPQPKPKSWFVRQKVFRGEHS